MKLGILQLKLKLELIVLEVGILQLKLEQIVLEVGILQLKLELIVLEVWHKEEQAGGIKLTKTNKTLATRSKTGTFKDQDGIMDMHKDPMIDLMHS